MGRIRKILAVLALIGSIALLVLPPPGNTKTEVVRAGALVLFAIGFWATGILPEYLTSLIFILMCVVFSLAPVSLIFSGFSSEALWLVFGGLVLAAAVKRTGLGERIAGWLLDLFGASYLMVLIGIVSLTVLAGFFLPSAMGRVVLFVPIVSAMAERLGFGEEAPGRKGMVGAVLMGCFVPSCAILPSSVPNMVLAGASESLYSITFGYTSYLKLHFPVTGALKAVAIVLLTRFIFPDRIPAAPPLKQRQRTLFSRQDWLLALILSGTLLLWSTDFIHGISPAWVGLGAALICMLPGTKLLSQEALGRELNPGPLFYMAGILGMGAVISKTGLGNVLGSEIIRLIGFTPGQTLFNFYLLSILLTAIVMVVTAPGLPALMVPLSADIATATGIPLATVLMTQVVAFSTPLLPYPIPPLIVGLHLGGLKSIEVSKITLALAALSLLLFIPLNYLWWSILGLF
jgi:anion transporter